MTKRKELIVWYVTGDPSMVGRVPYLWRTKLDAEAYAREIFPKESATERYARIHSREVMDFEEEK